MVGCSFQNRFKKKRSLFCKICPIPVNHYYIGSLDKSKSLDHCLPLSPSGLQDNSCAFSFCNLCCSVPAVSIYYQNIGKAFFLKVFNELPYSSSFVKCRNEDANICIIHVSHISFAGASTNTAESVFVLVFPMYFMRQIKMDIIDKKFEGFIKAPYCRAAGGLLQRSSRNLQGSYRLQLPVFRS